MASVSPKTWGLLLFAFEIYVLFRAFFQGRGRALWLLIPTFLLWANIDQSFLTGLLVLAAAAVGLWLDGKNGLRWPLVRKSRTRTPATTLARATSESRPPRPATALPHPGDLRGGLSGQPVYVPRLRGRDFSLPPALRARDENHDRRICFRSSARGFARTPGPNGICCRLSTSSWCSLDWRRSS